MMWVFPARCCRVSRAMEPLLFVYASYNLYSSPEEPANARRETHCECSPEGDTHSAPDKRCSTCVCRSPSKDNQGCECRDRGDFGNPS